MEDFAFAVVINAVISAAWLYLLVRDKKKGLNAVRVGLQTIFEMLPLILIIIGSLGILSSFITPGQISGYLGDRSGIKGFLFISVISSFLQIPGIIAFPIAQVLVKSGAAIGTVAVFASASTMSSIITLPIEMKYLGRKLPLIRIGLTYIICVLVGFAVGLIFRLFL